MRAFHELQLGQLRLFPGRSQDAAPARSFRCGLRDLSARIEEPVLSEADCRSGVNELR
jgi:hypothetical protein